MLINQMWPQTKLTAFKADAGFINKEIRREKMEFSKPCLKARDALLADALE